MIQAGLGSDGAGWRGRMSDTGVRIVEFEPQFASPVRELIQDIYREFGFGPDVTPDSDPDLFDVTGVYSGRSRFWLAMDSERLIGTGALREKAPELAEVKRMYLLSAYRGRGIGLALLEKAVRFAREQGYRRLQLETVAGLKQALRLYERYGFQKTGVHGYLTVYEMVL
jgi:putative acetyltransferase